MLYLDPLYIHLCMNGLFMLSLFVKENEHVHDVIQNYGY